MSKLIVSEIESTGTTVQINDDLKVGSTGTNAITSGNVVSPSEDMIKFFKAYETPVTAFDAAITGGVPGNSNAIPWEDAASGFTSTTALAVTSTGNSLLTNFSADAVFLYKSSGTANCKNDYWGITIDIPKVYRGQNIILNFDYRTENASTVETAADQWFIAVQDKTNTVKTTVTNTALVSAGAAVTVASKTGLVVGDKIWLEGGGNAQGSVSNGITQTYITSISGTANEITLSQDYTPASTAGSIAVVGYLSDTLDLLAAADSDTNKIGKNRKLAFKTADDTAQVNVWFQLRNTDSVVYSLFMDNIYISANKFLQASSMPKTESFIGLGWNDTDSATNTYVPYLKSGYLENVNTIKDLGTITNSSTYGWYFTASKQVKIVVSMGINHTSSSCLSSCMKVPDATNTPTSANVQSSDWDAYRMGSNFFQHLAGHSGMGTYEFIMEPGEDFLFVTDSYSGIDTDFKDGGITMTVTPEANDIIILESQDEIFTDWTDAGAITFSGTGQPTLASNALVNRVLWRRNGPDMELRYEYLQDATATGVGSGTEDYRFAIPGGYSIDTSKVTPYSGNQAAGFWLSKSAVGSGVRIWITSVDVASVVFVCDANSLVLGDTDLNATAGVMSSGWAPVANSQQTGYMFRATVPISGWNANFNPLLSMPLVEIGANKEEGLWDAAAGYGTAATKTQYFTNETYNQISNLGTVVNNSTDGWKFTASQKVKVNAVQVVNSVHGGAYWGWSLNSTSITTDIASLSFANGRRVVQGNMGANYIQTIPINLVMEPGDVLRPQHGGSTLNLGAYQSVQIVVEKDFSNTNMAHIIKPAVAIIKDVKAYNVTGGSNVGSSVWTPRTLNTIEGESWFVTLSGTTGFTLEPGTYEISWSTPFYRVEAYTSRLYDSTNSAAVADGVQGYNGNSGDYVQTESLGNAVTTIGSTTTYQIQYSSLVVNGTYGLGYYNYYQSASTSVYTQVKIRKLK